MIDTITTTTNDLAERINAEHEACEQALRAGLAHAMNCGDLLMEVKATLAHGQWGKWLADHFNGTDRTAQRYMRIANRREELEAKATHVSHLSYRDAVKRLADPLVSVPPGHADNDRIRASEAMRIVREAVKYGVPVCFTHAPESSWHIRRDAGPDGDWDKTCRERIGVDASLVKYLLEELDPVCLMDRTLADYAGADLRGIVANLEQAA